MVLHLREGSRDHERVRPLIPETTDHSLAAIVRAVHSSVCFDWKPSRSDGLKVHPPIPKSRAFFLVAHLSAIFDSDFAAAASDEPVESELPKMELPEMKPEWKPAPPVAHRTSRKSGSELYFQTRILDIAPA
jgi:hypothetical protein